ncbi:hypothetical protein [Nostoc sp.]|uniref:hypothetical protein n=1 Tax=Nostoc sp. TaxID=1180 RepID=UPI003FA5C91F
MKNNADVGLFGWDASRTITNYLFTKFNFSCLRSLKTTIIRNSVVLPQPEGPVGIF